MNLRLSAVDLLFDDLRLSLNSSSAAGHSKSRDLIFQSGADSCTENTSGKIAVREKNYEYGFCAPEFYPIPETDFEQAVFQSGVWLPEWERFYLIRCLYSSTNQKNRFLGWKVQLLKDIGNGKELSHPIWAMNEIEEEVLETVLMDNRIFSKEDLEQANTPAKDRLRRKNFLKQK